MKYFDCLDRNQITIMHVLLRKLYAVRWYFAIMKQFVISKRDVNFSNLLFPSIFYNLLKGASIFFNRFQNPNNVQIGVGGWVMAR